MCEKYRTVLVAERPRFRNRERGGVPFGAGCFQLSSNLPRIPERGWLQAGCNTNGRQGDIPLTQTCNVGTSGEEEAGNHFRQAGGIVSMMTSIPSGLTWRQQFRRRIGDRQHDDR